MAPFADVEVEQDGHMDDEDVLVANLLHKEKETVQGVEGVVAELAEDDGTGRTSTTTECLGTARKDDGGLNELPKLTPNRTGCPCVFLTVYILRVRVIFQATFFSWRCWHQRAVNQLACSCKQCNQTCLCHQGWNVQLRCSVLVARISQYLFCWPRDPKQEQFLLLKHRFLCSKRASFDAVHENPTEHLWMRWLYKIPPASLLGSLLSLSHSAVFLLEGTAPSYSLNFPTSPTTTAKIWKLTLLTLVLVNIPSLYVVTLAIFFSLCIWAYRKCKGCYLQLFTDFE